MQLAAAAFTNLSRDHLDYHPTMEAYLAAKLRLFEQLLPAGATAVVNADIEPAARMREIAKRRGQRLITFGRTGTEIKLLKQVPGANGQTLELDVLGKRHTVTFPVVARAVAEGDLDRARFRVERDLEMAACVVLAGAASVIACAPHRQDAFAAAEFLMDYLKTRAPFWKKEITREGGEWVAAKDSDDEAAERWAERRPSK